MDTFLQVGIDAVKKAGEQISKYYHGEVAVEMKENDTPVTIADKEGERIIREYILSVFPEHGFIGEEMGNTTLDSEYLWIIDPIDATKNFIRHIPLWGTLLALQKNGEIILGISYMPEMNELLHASVGNGAFLNGKPVHVSETADIPSAFIAYGGVRQFVSDGLAEKLMDTIEKAHRDRGIGDLYNYHLLATGRCDAVLEARVAYWDIAPFLCIIPEAGGSVSDLHGEVMENKEVSTFLASGSGVLHESIVQRFI
ncbi:inositol-phosphate phosphatase [Candidatus Nomurabacteria bacterium]|nr:inositol-phosphate phosphatase [Candidatus Nomurabacteria bacterium]